MSVRCQHLEDSLDIFKAEVAKLEREIDRLPADIRRSVLEREHKRALKRKASAEADLRKCQNEDTDLPSQPPGMRDFGTEISQGIGGYSLVAGKDTIVRVYLALDRPVVATLASLLTQEEQVAFQGTSFLNDIVTRPPLFGSNIDRAELLITPPDAGAPITVEGDIGDGVFSNLSKSFVQGENAQFNVAGPLLARAGRYKMVARFFRNGQVVAEREVGGALFNKSGDLRVLVVVEIWPFPANKWPVLQEALRETSRIFPIRSGVVPLNSTAPGGLRYIIEPDPIDFAFPDRTPVADRLDAFNAEQAAANRPERADHVMTIRTQQPGEPALGGVAQPGPDGRISGVVLNVNPNMDGSFGTLVAHELAHNFLPEAEGHIDTEFMMDRPEAINLRTGTPLPSPRNLMFPTYDVNGNNFLEPRQWERIRAKLAAREAG